MKRLTVGFAALLVLLGVGQAMGAVIGTALGTGVPPATLGPYTMTPFGVDPQLPGATVGSVASPLGGSVGFTPSLIHLSVPGTWATWSHNYTGDVYHTGSGVLTATLTLPPGTGAFYLYAEPNPMTWHTITATDASGISVTQSVQGSSGAAGYGFHTTTSTLATITVSCPTADFAVGEFGIAPIPEPASLIVWSLLGALGIAVGWWTRRRKAA